MQRKRRSPKVVACTWEDLPLELVLLIFDRVGSALCIYQVSRVRRAWYRISRDPLIWRNLSHRLREADPSIAIPNLPGW